MRWWAILGPRGGILRGSVAPTKTEAWSAARDNWDYPGDLACSCVQVDVVTRERMDSLLKLVDPETLAEWQRRPLSAQKPEATR